MLIQALLLLFAMDGGVVKFKSMTTLQTDLDDYDLFVQMPQSFDIDSTGNYYMLDAGARTILVWDKKGKFSRKIGVAGDGPGELVLEGRGPDGGFVSVFNNTLYVLDMPKRKILTFDTKTGEFQKEISLLMARGRIINFYVVDEGRILIQRRMMKDDGVVNEVVVLDHAGKTLNVLNSVKDDTFKPQGRPGGRFRFTIKAFNPAVVSFYDNVAGELLMGDSASPSFDIYNLKGEKLRTLKSPLPQEDVTAEDKAEQEERFATRSRKPTIDFPDKKAFYTHLLSLGEKGYLVYQQSPTYRNITGLHLAKDGDVKGRFTMSCGSEGGLMASRGHLLSVTLDEDEEFLIKEISVD